MSDVMRDAYCVLRNTKYAIRFISQNIHLKANSHQAFKYLMSDECPLRSMVYFVNHLSESRSLLITHQLYKSKGYIVKSATTLLYSTSLMNLPVCDVSVCAISSGVPQATIYPPLSPPSGPRSMI